MSELTSVIKYLEEQAVKLSRASNKLRKQLTKFFKCFGTPTYCRVCGWEESSHPRHVSDHSFAPRVHVSLNIDDVETFCDFEDCNGRWVCFLAFRDNELRVVARNLEFGAERYYTPDNAPREVLKALVRSGRIVAFLRYAATVLEEKGREYEEVAALAEKIAAAALQ